MKHVIFILSLTLLLLGGNAMALTLESSAFSHEGAIPKEFTCEGADKSPQLKWSGAPEGTKSFALIVDDPDAPPGTWVHWVIYNIPGTATGLDENLAKTEKLSDGSRQGMVWGVEDFSKLGYHGPCPPPGKPHRYFFKLYALDQTLDLGPKATKPQIENAIQGHILAETKLMGTFGR